jgi:O-antigen/teichoic acid export membrane protein
MRAEDGRRASGVLSNAVWSLLGQIVPAAVGFLVVPRIVAGFGDGRFGLLSLAWAVIGYLSFLDLGISRAVTRSVAASLAHARVEELRVQVSSALAIMLGVGCAAALILYPLAPWISQHALSMPPELREETLLVVRLLCIGLPITLLMNALRGVLEAYQKFGFVNAVRVPFGISTFLIPWLTLSHSRSVALVIAWLMAARVVAVAAYLIMCVRVMGEHARPRRPSRAAVRELLDFGAWIMVSNIVSPLMVSFDRFIIGGLISVAMVTYYVTPYQIATQLLIVPMAVSTVLFPMFAALWERDRPRLGAVYVDGLHAVFVVMLAAAALVMAVAPELLAAWLGPRFAGPSATPLRWLMVGVLMNGIAHIPFAFIQGAGRSDWTAKLHLAEAPLYAVALVVSARRFGLSGVALVWSLRTTLDLIVLYLLAARLNTIPSSVRRRDAGYAIAALAALALVVWPVGLLGRVGVALAIVAACAVLGYRRFGDRLRARQLDALVTRGA